VLGLLEDMVSAFSQKKDIQYMHQSSGEKKNELSGSNEF
jgi:hypothetical protein